ncbi:MAG: DNA topoisomerase VI subunit B, partial [Thermoproteota archaeon]
RNVADRPELERELKNALQFLARKLAVHMSRKGMADMAKKRANLYSKYVPLIAQFVTELSGNKKEPNYKQLVQKGSEIEEQV